MYNKLSGSTFIFMIMYVFRNKQTKKIISNRKVDVHHFLYGHVVK